MTLTEFVERYRTEIDRHIQGVAYDLTDEDRADWVMNDEGLYNWAISEGIEGEDTDDVTGACDD